MSRSGNYISAKLISAAILIFALSVLMFNAEPLCAQSKRPSAADINAYLNSDLLAGTPRRGRKVDVTGSGFFTDFTDNVRVTKDVPELQLSDTQSGGHLWRLMSGASPSGSFNVYDNNAGAYRLTIDGSGNIGIGTTSPGVALDIGGIPIAANNSRTIRIAALTGGYYYGAGLEGGFDGSGSGFTRLHTYHSGIDYTILYGNSSGNVGIGTTSPLAKFHVEGLSGSYTGYFHGLSTTSQSLGVLIDAGTNSSDYPLRVRSYNSADYFAIRGDGNVGIGTTSPANALQVSLGATNNSVVASFGNTARADAVRVTIDPSSNGLIQLRQGAGTIGTVLTSSGDSYFNGGKVGIGRTDPAYTLDVTGDTRVTGNINLTGTINAKYQDVAEWVPASEQLSAGTVVVLDSSKSNQVTSSSVSYDTRVAGVVSDQPGIALGEKSENKVLVATTGRVRVKVDASKGAIHIGDLLVTSDVPGVAMKSQPIDFAGRKMHMPGTLIGKALEPLEKGSGEILVLLSLQ